MLPLRLDDIAHIDELVVPSVQRSDLWRSVLEQVGDLAGGHSRHDLLPQRRIRGDGRLDLIAARLLVIGNELLERDILFMGEALDPPNRRCFCLGISDIRGAEGACGGG